MDSERSSKTDVRKLGRYPYDSMCGGFGCLYVMNGAELSVITDNGSRKSFGKHFLGKDDDWGACSLGPVLRRGDRFFLVTEDGAEVFLCEERCEGWQGGVGCLYFVNHYNDFTFFPIIV